MPSNFRGITLIATMQNLPEINHCNPNPKAYWCATCKAHNTFDIKSSRSGNNTTWTYHCKACRFSMFNPADVSPWKKGLTVFTVLAFLIAIPLGFICLVKGDTNSDSFSISLGLAGFGAFVGWIPWMMHNYMRKWNVWHSAQRRKSPEQLTQEGMNHPFQPEYESSGNFTDWANQFLTPEEVEQLHLKYGRGMFIPTDQ